MQKKEWTREWDLYILWYYWNRKYDVDTNKVKFRLSRGWLSLVGERAE